MPKVGKGQNSGMKRLADTYSIERWEKGEKSGKGKGKGRGKKSGSGKGCK